MQRNRVAICIPERKKESPIVRIREEKKKIKISIKDEVIGRLYAGDWMFFPWDSDVVALDANDSAVEAQAYTHEAILEYCLFHNGETRPTSDDS